MIYTEMTRKAINVAYKAHEDQYDISGIPYVFHPFTVAMDMPDEITTSAAILHDVVEDTQLSVEDLQKEFPKEVTELVEILTHTRDEDYFEYIERIKQNERAVIIKLADLKHNMDRTRISGVEVSKETLDKWDFKYKKALEILKK